MMRACFSFMMSTKKLKKLNDEQLALAAIWTDMVTRRIRECDPKTMTVPLTDHLRDLQLQDKHIQLLKQKQITEIDIKNARNKYMEAFDIFKGVELPEVIMKSQQRFQNAINKNNKVTFYPNTFVTPIIFKAVHKNSFGWFKEMIVGKPGISKSMALILNWYNSAVGTAYRYKNVADATDLIKEGLLEQNFAKILFINFNNNLNNVLDFAKELVNQCPQIKPQLQNYLKDEINKEENKAYFFGGFLQKIVDLYGEKNIKCLLILDQINTLASKFKRYNLLRGANKNKEESNEFVNLGKLVQSLNDVHQGIGGRIRRLYNSSSNIEPQLLGEPNEAQNIYFALNLNHHEQLSYIKCQFNEENMKKIQNKELYRYIWYEAAKIFNDQESSDNKNLSEAEDTQIERKDFSKAEKAKKAKQLKSSPPLNKQKIQEIFLSKCDQLALRQGFLSSVTPLSIRQQIGGLKFPEKTQKQIKLFIENVFEKINSSGMEILKSKSMKFINDENLKMRQKKFSVALECWNHILKSQDSVSIPFSQVPSLKNENFKKIPDLVDRNLYDIDNQAQYLKLICERSQIRQIYDEILKQIIISKNLPPIFRKLIFDKQMVLGVSIQSAIITILETYTSSYLTDMNKTFSFRTEPIKLKFIAMLKNKFDLYEQFRQIFEVAKKLPKNIPNLYSFAKPIRASGKNSPNNPSIDFIGVRQMQKDNFCIASFDVTIDKKFSDVKQKAIKFKRLIKKLLNQQIVIVKEENKQLKKLLEKILQHLKINIVTDKDMVKFREFLSLQESICQKKQVPESFLNLLKQIIEISNSSEKKLQQITDQIVKLLKDKQLIEIKKIENTTGVQIQQWNHFIICLQENYIKNQEIFDQFAHQGVRLKIQLLNLNKMEVSKTKTTAASPQTQQFRSFLGEAQKYFEKSNNQP